MASVTETRTYHVDRKEAFTYLTTPSTWPDWYSGVVSVEDPDSFEKAGDTLEFTYSLLGRRIQARAVVEEMRDGEVFRVTSSASGLPDVQHSWEYEDAEDGVSVRVTLATEESTNVFGKAIDRLLIPRTLEGDLKRSLDKIDDVFALGVPDA